MYIRVAAAPPSVLIYRSPRVSANTLAGTPAPVIILIAPGSCKPLVAVEIITSPSVAVISPSVAVIAPSVAVISPSVAVMSPSVVVIFPSVAVISPIVDVISPCCYGYITCCYRNSRVSSNESI